MKFTIAAMSFLLLCVSPARGATLKIEELKGPEVVGGHQVTPNLKGRKGVVVAFLSAVCPCSNSHLKELSALSNEYPDFDFFGVHSNTDEEKEPTQKYFREANLPFPTIQDSGARIADAYKALKTPHVFVILTSGEVAYQGGVSSSRNFDSADRKFLREALEDLKQHRAVKTPEGRTLGCVIAREEKHVW